MSTLYYIETKHDTLPQLIEKLKWFGLKTDVVEEHYKSHILIDGEMIMWGATSNYPTWVFRSQEDIIKSCGIKIKY